MLIVDLELYYARFRPTNRNIVDRVYGTIDPILHIYMEQMQTCRAHLGMDEEQVVLPRVSNEQVQNFLDKLGAGSPYLTEAEITLFDYLHTVFLNYDFLCT